MRLSFCIPVFNFGNYLAETLESVIPQLTEDAEVVVLDGGSTDATPELMRRICLENPRIRYLRKASPGGIDADLAECIDAAQGEYCWLLSGDDTIKPGALLRILKALTLDPDVLLLRHTNCDASMRWVSDQPVLRTDQTLFVNLADPEDRRRWLALACNTEALFSFMSTVVVRRSAWLSEPMPSEFRQSCWAHVARLLEVAKRGLQVHFDPEPQVNRRGENDSFRSQGIVRRLAISVDGFHRIAEIYGRDPAERAHIGRLVRADLPIRFFIGAKMASRRSPVRESRSELDRLVLRCYGAAGSLGKAKALGYRLFPPVLEGPARLALALLRRKPDQA